MDRLVKSEFSCRKIKFLLRLNSTASVRRLLVKLWLILLKLHDFEIKFQISLVSWLITGMELFEFSNDISILATFIIWDYFERPCEEGKGVVTNLDKTGKRGSKSLFFMGGLWGSVISRATPFELPLLFAYFLRSRPVVVGKMEGFFAMQGYRP